MGWVLELLEKTGRTFLWIFTGIVLPALVYFVSMSLSVKQNTANISEVKASMVIQNDQTKQDIRRLESRQDLLMMQVNTSLEKMERILGRIEGKVTDKDE